MNDPLPQESAARPAHAGTPSVFPDADFYTWVFEQAPVGMTVIDLSARTYVAVNPAFCALVGRSAGDLVGRGPQAITYADDQAVDDRIISYLQTSAEPAHFEKRYVRPDGGVVWVRLTVVPQSEDGRPTGQAITIAEDVTEQRRQEAALLRRLEFDEYYARTLIELTGSTYNDAEATITKSLSEFSEYMHADYAFVVMLREDGRSWGLTHSWHGPDVPSLAEATRTVSLDMTPWTAGVLMNDEVISIRTLNDFPAEAVADRRFHEALGVQSVLEVPMKGRRQAVVGTIGLLRRQPTDGWSEADVRLTRLLGSAIASTLERVQAQSEIRVTQEAVIYALARLAESRDHVTGQHIECVQDLCRTIAEELQRNSPYADQIDQEFISTLVRAAPLHDIGKVGIPDAILLKPGRLTSAEFEVAKTHTVIGARTLKDVHDRHPRNTVVAMGVDIARSHHERWDGTGYPDGLAGEAIPLAARIMALADVYEALRSPRTYKDPIPHEESVKLVMAGSGWQFDSVVAEAFERISDKMGTVWESCQWDPSGLAPGLDEDYR